MPKLAALASAADNICFASSSVRLVYVRGISPHLTMDRIFKTTLSFLFSRLHLTRIHFCVFLREPGHGFAVDNGFTCLGVDDASARSWVPHLIGRDSPSCNCSYPL